MTISYEDIFTIDLSDAPSGSEVILETAVRQALLEIEQTVEGQALLEKVNQIVGNTTITFEYDEDSEAYVFNWYGYNMFPDVNINENQLFSEGYFTVTGELHHHSLQGLFAHELFHLADTVIDSGALRESRAIQFANEYMAKYYGEDRRVIHTGEILATNNIPQPSSLLNPYFLQTGYSNYEFIGEAGEDILSLINAIDSDEFSNNANNYFYKVIAAANGFDPAGDEITVDYTAATGSVFQNDRTDADVLDTLYTKIIYGFTGNDTISLAGGYSIVYGGEGNDSIIGNGSNSTIIGGRGNDVIDAGNPTTSDQDTLLFSGDFGHDTVSGGEVLVVDGVTLSGSAQQLDINQYQLNGMIIDKLGANEIKLTIGNNSIHLTDWNTASDYGAAHYRTANDSTTYSNLDTLLLAA